VNKKNKSFSNARQLGGHLIYKDILLKLINDIN